MKTTVAIFTLILSACAGSPNAGTGKSTNNVVNREKIYKNKLEHRQDDHDRDLLLSKKYQKDGHSSRFQAVPQRKKLELQISSESDTYDTAMIMVSQHHYGEALFYFNRVISKYPNTFSARSAMFQKAALYLKMNLSEESRRAMFELKNRYPGSLEAKRAEIALQTMK